MRYPKNQQAGFTLLEMLVSMTILLTVGSLVFATLFISIRSTNKINSTQLIRQNGNDMLTQMSRMIQFSQHFDGVSDDGVLFDATCEAPVTANGTLHPYQYVRFTAFDNGQTTFACVDTPPSIASNSASLLDTNTYTITNCKFTCSQVNPSSPQTVGLSFTINKKNINSFLEDPAPIDFSTSVTIRNYAY